MPPGSTFRRAPPRLRTTADPDGERHATWFELYFDLVFVAAVGQLAAALASDPTGPVFARFAGLFVVVAWAWAGFTLYANRFDTDDLIDVYIAGFSFTAGLWLVSMLVPGPFRYLLWGVAIAIDLAIPPRAWRALQGAPIVVSHLTERFGTFFIIVLGESVMGVVAGVSGFEFSSASWAVAAVCFVIALCLWWIYFDLADTSVLGRGLLGLIYIDGHLPLLAGVAAFGAGTRLAITHASAQGLAAGVRWALAGGIAAFAMSLALFHIGAEWTSPRDHTLLGRVLLAALAISLAAAGGRIAPLAFVVLIAASVLTQLLLEAFTEPHGAASIWEPSVRSDGAAR